MSNYCVPLRYHPLTKQWYTRNNPSDAFQEMYGIETPLHYHSVFSVTDPAIDTIVNCKLLRHWYKISVLSFVSWKPVCHMKEGKMMLPAVWFHKCI